MAKIGIKFVQGGKVYNVEVEDGEYNLDDKVVVDSVRGMEIAYVCKPATSSEEAEVKSVIRLATPEDEKKYDELKKQEENVMKITNDLIKKYNLQMKLVDVQFTLDGSKVIINYVCEDRVDFRELVKDLASQLKLRIELRQIGIRDQAKKIGGIGFCGKECCCKKYLNDFDKVSIKMAKTQGLSLNPSKISGICGRLMCCLSYENEFYSEVSIKMPKLNAKVKTPDGVGTVIYNNLLKQVSTVKIETENDTKINEYPAEQLVVIPKDTQNNQKEASKGFKDNKKITNADDLNNEKNVGLEKDKKSEEKPENKNSQVKENNQNKKFKKFKKYDKNSKK